LNTVIDLFVNAEVVGTPDPRVLLWCVSELKWLLKFYATGLQLFSLSLYLSKTPLFVKGL